MRTVAFLLALCFSLASTAATRESDYWPVRDESQARFAKFDLGHPPPTKEDLRDHDDALARLGAMLSTLVGASGVKGFEGPGVSNVDTLFLEPGFGQLDGLAWDRKDLDARLVVTTPRLLENWVASRRDLPQTIPAALKSELFYTSGLVVDQHWEWYAEIPIQKPPGASFAVAFAGLRSNDTGDYAPNAIAIAVVTPSRAYFFDVGSNDVARIPECHDLWSRYATQARAALARYRASKAQSEENEYDRLEEAGAAALRACYAERAPRQPSFASVIRKAQSFVDRTGRSVDTATR